MGFFGVYRTVVWVNWGLRRGVFSYNYVVNDGKTAGLDIRCLMPASPG